MAMKYPITTESLDIMLRMSKVTSPAMKAALHDHLVSNMPKAAAAARNGVAKQQLGPAVRQLLEKVKPAFDDYAELFGVVPHP